MISLINFFIIFIRLSSVNGKLFLAQSISIKQGFYSITISYKCLLFFQLQRSNILSFDAKAINISSINKYVDKLTHFFKIFQPFIFVLLLHNNIKLMTLYYKKPSEKLFPVFYRLNFPLPLIYFLIMHNCTILYIPENIIF